MSISALSGLISANYSNYGSVQSKMEKMQQAFSQLGRDLQSGDVPAAQSDLNALEQYMPQTSSPASTSSTSSDSIAAELSRLSKDLQSGVGSSAQKDYSTIKQDFAKHAAHAHTHRAGSSGSDSSSNEVLRELNALSSALQSNDTSGAQTAYSSLLSDLETYAQQNGLAITSTQTGSSSVSLSA
jgi:hypothetical protein